ncbi:AMP-binding protein [Frankia sp. AgPm24]|uniref:(2,3-dihydroxybenzoyl)adenylate synthase n=1 Tax=Frankia sp. AgPm24 TaxID=631128 RepID=UPI00200CA120|nr:AMP-binding protein [Frankia sp. AgPm24]MCK9921039.1 AMP-binding protein [Frankia sp. AgPm24]
MLPGCTPWPPELARDYRTRGIWAGRTLGEVLSDAAVRHGEATLLVHGERRVSYAELDAWADRFATGFAAHGVSRGDRVVVQLPNCPDFVAVVFGLFRIGAVPVFSLVAHRATELTHLVRLSGATRYVLPATHRGFDHLALARQIHTDTDTLRTMFVLTPDTCGAAGTADAPEGFVSLALVERAGAASLRPVPAADTPTAVTGTGAGPGPSDVAFFLLSGGTTALPKMIPRTHDDYVYQSTQAARVCGLTPADVYLAALPIEFNFAFGCPGVVGTLLCGGTVVLADSPNPLECLPLVERHGVTVTALVPSVVALWLDAADWSGADLTSLRLVQVGGARMTREFTSRIGPGLGGSVLQQVFGMAEGLLTFTRPDDPVETILTTQGRPVSAEDELRIAGPDGAPLPADEIGELLTRGPYTLRGYYRVPDYNQRVFTPDGFFRTGDLARLTEAGDLVIEGRIKEMIIRGGDKISAGEVEDHLLAHPGVRAAAVTGVPDEFLGERICAHLVVDGPPPSLSELKQAMHARGVADYKLPDAVRFVDEFPLTPLGKIDKLALAEQAASERKAHAV